MLCKLAGNTVHRTCTRGEGEAVQSPSPDERRSILFVNLSPMFVEILGSELTQYRVGHVVGTAYTAAATELFLRTQRPEVALVGSEKTTGRPTGLSFVEQIALLAPKTRQIVLDHGESRGEAALFLRAGARGIVCEPDLTSPVLVKCIQCVAAGQIWANTEQIEELIATPSPRRHLRVKNALGDAILSRREEEVLYCLAEGLSNRELADRLKLSEHTIKNHIFRMFNKLGVSSRMEAVLYALNWADQTGSDSPFERMRVHEPFLVEKRSALY
jgi:DNA-binding NarL/FixJ family response regulator